MNNSLRFIALPIMTFALSLSMAACHSNPDQNAANTAPNATQDQSSDPAAANLAPASTDAGTAPAPSYAPQGSQTQSSPSYQGSNQYPPDNNSSDDSDYGEQPVATAPQAPPPLPEYDQPPAPGDDYLWTPGYWSYAPTGYYWVPGVWVQAPYQGALWTPGYWGYRHNHYEFFRGYWGPHIGFYGGVNYGFGYVGVGYQGGYWNHGHFNYNRSVNNVNVTVVHNVYNYHVDSRPAIRVSFNGGSGGINVRPRPAELAALREPHAPPMTAQVRIERSASTNRAQFASVNKGRPADPVIHQPIAADHDVRPVARISAPNPPNNAAPGRPGIQQPQQRPGQPQAPPQHPAGQPQRPASPQPNAPQRPADNHAAHQQSPEQRPSPGQRPSPPQQQRPAQPATPQRPANNRPMPQQPPAQRPAQHPVAPAPQRPMPAAPQRPAENRPAPTAQRPASQPAPQHAAPARPETKPETPHRPASPQKEKEK